MNKMVVMGIAGVTVLALVGGAGFFGFKMYSELSGYKKLGPQTQLATYAKENFDLKKQNKLLLETNQKIERKFVVHRKLMLQEAANRAERKVATSVASFLPISGTYVLSAAAVQEQLERCQDIEALLKLEKELFEKSDPEVLAQKEKICETYIDRKLTPLFKYQMLRIRASMTGSLGHLRSDAEKKFDKARDLLKKWDVPVSRELESYTRFER